MMYIRVSLAMCLFMISNALAVETLQQPDLTFTMGQAMIKISAKGTYLWNDGSEWEDVSVLYNSRQKPRDGSFKGQIFQATWGTDNEYTKEEGRLLLEVNVDSSTYHINRLELDQVTRNLWDGKITSTETWNVRGIRPIRGYTNRFGSLEFEVSGQDLSSILIEHRMDNTSPGEPPSWRKLTHITADDDQYVQIKIYSDMLFLKQVLPEVKDGFPEVTDENQIDFHDILLGYYLYSDLGAEVQLTAYANHDSTHILGQSTQSISASTLDRSGTISFDQLVAKNVGTDITSITLRAFLKPDNVSGYSALSDSIVYSREPQDALEIAKLDPLPSETLNSKEFVSVIADLNFLLLSGKTGQIRLDISTDAGEVVHSQSVSVSDQQTLVRISTGLIVPESSDRLQVDAVLISDTGYETESAPHFYQINRIKFDFTNPLPAEWLLPESDVVFKARLVYNLARQTEKGQVHLDLYDEIGHLLQPPPDVDRDRLKDLSTGSAVTEMQTQNRVPKGQKRIMLVATLLDQTVPLTSDTIIYKITLDKGKLTILNSDPKVPLANAELIVSKDGEILNQVKSDEQGLYRFYLDPGEYQLLIKPEELDFGIRQEKLVPLLITDEMEKWPDFELGVVNVQQKLEPLTKELAKYANPEYRGRTIPGFPSLPYAEEMAEIQNFAKTQPQMPLETDERLYRLYYATRALEQISDNSAEISSDMGPWLVDMVWSNTILGQWKGKMQALVSKVLKKLGDVTIFQALVKSTKLDLWLLKYTHKLSGLFDAFRNRIMDYLVSSVDPSSNSGARFRKVIELFIGQMSTEDSFFSVFLSGPAGAEGWVKGEAGKVASAGLLALKAEYFVSPSVQKVIRLSKNFSPPNDKLKFDQDDVQVGIRLSRERTNQMVYSTTTGSRAIVYDLAGSIKGGIDAVNASLAPLLAFPATTAIAVPVHVFFRKLSVCLDKLTKGLQVYNFSENAARLYYQIPSEMDRTMASAFHRDYLMLPDAAIQTGYEHPARIGLPVPLEISRTMNIASHHYEQDLVQLKDIISRNDYDKLITFMNDDLFASDDALESALKSAEAPIQSAAALTSRADTDFAAEFKTMSDISIAFTAHRIELFTQLFSLVLKAMATDSPDDSDFQTQKSGMIDAIEKLVSENNSLNQVLSSVTEKINNAGTVLPTLAVEDMSVNIENDSKVIHSFPVNVRVTAKIKNASQQPVNGLTASLAPFDPRFGMSFNSSRSHQISGLQGLETTSFEWNLTFSGPMSLVSIPFCLVLEPADNVYVQGSQVLMVNVIDTLDTDQDAIPDRYEQQNGLNPTVPNINTDRDDDGLIDLTEYMLDTDPQVRDTDGDGFDDGSEVRQGSDPVDPALTPENNVPIIRSHLDTYTVMPDCTFSLSIPLQDFWGHQIYSADIRLEYDPDVLLPLTISPGDLARNHGWTFNSQIHDHQIWFAMAGVTPLNDVGSLADIEFEIIGFAGDSSGLRYTLFNLNEGDPAVWIRNGMLHVSEKTLVDNQPGMQLDQFQLMPNYPNPFNHSTTIGYTLPMHMGSTKVSVEIYNLRGECIETIYEGIQSPGFYQIEWSGENSSQSTVSSGIFICRIRAGKNIRISKMTLLK